MRLAGGDGVEEEEISSFAGGREAISFGGWFCVRQSVAVAIMGEEEALARGIAEGG